MMKVIISIALIMVFTIQSVLAGYALLPTLTFQSQEIDKDPAGFVDFEIYMNPEEAKAGKYYASGELVFGSTKQVVQSGNIVKVLFEPTGILPQDVMCTWMGVRYQNSEDYEWQINQKLRDLIGGRTVNTGTYEELTEILDDMSDDERIQKNLSSVFYIDLNKVPDSGLVRLRFGCTHKGNKKKYTIVFWSFTTKTEGEDSSTYAFQVSSCRMRGFTINLSDSEWDGVYVPVETVGGDLKFSDIDLAIESNYQAEEIEEKKELNPEGGLLLVQENLLNFDQIQNGQVYQISGDFKINFGSRSGFKLTLPEGFDQRIHEHRFSESEKHVIELPFSPMFDNIDSIEFVLESDGEVKNFTVKK